MSIQLTNNKKNVQMDLFLDEILGKDLILHSFIIVIYIFLRNIIVIINLGWN